MPKTISISSTPNPHSLKFSAENSTFIHSGLISVSDVSDAENDEFSLSLISIEGVSNVFILPQFVTITKDPNTSWNDIAPKVESLLEKRIARK